MNGWHHALVSDGEILINNTWHYLLCEDGTPAPHFRHNGDFMISQRNDKTYVCCSHAGAIDMVFYVIGDVTLDERANILGHILGHKQKKQARYPRATDLPVELQGQFWSYVSGWRRAWSERGRKV